MLDLINHRGPDQSGSYRDETNDCVLGHKRLSILDLSEAGKQPMSTPDGKIVVVFNGEIYNFRTLKADLTAKYDFQSTSDTEVLLYGYLEWGMEGLLDRLRGMFAFCLLDVVEGIYYLARDRIGIKPLYYMDRGVQFFFASEMKAIIPFDSNFKLSRDRLDHFWVFNFLPLADQTLTSSIKKLAPGHYLRIQGANRVLRRYWDLPRKANAPVPFKRACAQLDSILHKVVCQHMIADVPVGLLLSGGLDSSLLAAIAQAESPQSIQTFTASFDHPLEESRFAQQVADYLKTDHTTLHLDLEEIADQAENHIDVFDDLSSLDAGIITMRFLSKKIAERGIKVVLVGEGADEVFGGYPWFRLESFPFSFFPRRLKKMLHFFALLGGVFGNRSRQWNLFNNFFKNEGRDSYFKIVSRFEIQDQLPNHLLMKVDKGTMAHSLEARVPYLDHRLVEFAFGLPDNYKVNGMFGRHNKRILREVARAYIPEAIASRKKQGFLLPIEPYVKVNHERIRTLLLKEDSLARQWLGLQVQDLLRSSSVRLKERFRLNLLWRVYLVELWHKKFSELLLKSDNLGELLPKL